VAPGLVKYSSLADLADHRSFEFGQVYLMVDELIDIPDADSR